MNRLAKIRLQLQLLREKGTISKLITSHFQINVLRERPSKSKCESVWHWHDPLLCMICDLCFCRSGLWKIPQFWRQALAYDRPMEHMAYYCCCHQLLQLCPVLLQRYLLENGPHRQFNLGLWFSLCVLGVASCFLLLQLFKLGAYLSFWMQNSGVGRYCVYFQSRFSYMSKKDSYPVLVKRIRKWSFRVWLYAAGCRYLIYKWVNNCSFQVLKGNYIYRNAWLRCLIRYRCFLKPSWILIVEIHFTHINKLIQLYWYKMTSTYYE